MERVTDIRYVPITPKGSHYGFVDFSLDGALTFKDMDVHKRRDGKGFRVGYRQHPVSKREWVKPQNKEIQEVIDTAITQYLEEIGYGTTSNGSPAK